MTDMRATLRDWVEREGGKVRYSLGWVEVEPHRITTVYLRRGELLYWYRRLFMITGMTQLHQKLEARARMPFHK